MKHRYYITTPIYYVNDQPHIGHAYTTVVADVLARHYRRLEGGDNVFFLTGTDEHGQKIAQEAQRRWMQPKEFADLMSQAFKKSWQLLNISHNNFIRTTDEDHKTSVQKILERLRQAKTPSGREAIYAGTYKGLYCVGCEKFLTAKELVDGHCPLHKTKPQELEEQNWFFRLTDYLPLVKQKIEKGEINIFPAERRNETLGLLAQGLDDFSISRSTVSWGIAVPWDPAQTVYVWVDALFNYITNLRWPEEQERLDIWWEQGQVMQLMAMEILKFHAIYWPAFLLALDLAVPKHLYVHGFFTIDGEKMSKSLGNVVSPNDLVDRYGADATRYLILSQFPFGYESDIRVEDFTQKYNADLADGLGNLVSRVVAMAVKYFNGTVTIKRQRPKEFLHQVDELIQFLQFREALLLVWQRVAAADKLIDEAKPWRLAESDPARLKDILERLLSELDTIAVALEPFMPDTAAKIHEILGGTPLVKPAGLFAKIKE